MSQFDSRPIRQQYVYAQPNEPDDKRDGIMWVNTGKDGNPISTWDESTQEWEPANPSGGIKKVQEVEDFNNASSVTHDNTVLNSGSIGLRDTQADQLDYTAETYESGSDGRGWEIEILDSDTQAIQFRVGNYSGVEYDTIELQAEGGDLLDSWTGTWTATDTITIEYDWQVGSRYWIMPYGPTGTTPDFSHSLQTGSHIDHTAGVYNVDSTTTDYAYGFDMATVNPDGAFDGSATVTVDALPTQLSAWDLADYDSSPDGGGITVDVLDSSGVVNENISRKFDVSHVDISENFDLRFNLSRDDPASQSPSVSYSARRYER